VFNTGKDWWPIIAVNGQTSQDVVLRRKFPYCELRDVISTFEVIELGSHFSAPLAIIRP
jgi:hypothetical protein